MAEQSDSMSIPLPLGWPGRDESATRHVISLAQFALAHTRGWAVNSQVAIIRRQMLSNAAQQPVQKSLDPHSQLRAWTSRATCRSSIA